MDDFYNDLWFRVNSLWMEERLRTLLMISKSAEGEPLPDDEDTPLWQMLHGAFPRKLAASSLSSATGEPMTVTVRMLLPTVRIFGPEDAHYPTWVPLIEGGYSVPVIVIDLPLQQLELRLPMPASSESISSSDWVPRVFYTNELPLTQNARFECPIFTNDMVAVPTDLQDKLPSWVRRVNLILASVGTNGVLPFHAVSHLPLVSAYKPVLHQHLHDELGLDETQTDEVWATVSGDLDAITENMLEAIRKQVLFAGLLGAYPKQVRTVFNNLADDKYLPMDLVPLTPPVEVLTESDVDNGVVYPSSAATEAALNRALASMPLDAATPVGEQGSSVSQLLEDSAEALSSQFTPVAHQMVLEHHQSPQGMPVDAIKIEYRTAGAALRLDPGLVGLTADSLNTPIGGPLSDEEYEAVSPEGRVHFASAVRMESILAATQMIAISLVDAFRPQDNSTPLGLVDFEYFPAGDDPPPFPKFEAVLRDTDSPLVRTPVGFHLMKKYEKATEVCGVDYHWSVDLWLEHLQSYWRSGVCRIELGFRLHLWTDKGVPDETKNKRFVIEIALLPLWLETGVPEFEIRRTSEFPEAFSFEGQTVDIEQTLGAATSADAEDYQTAEQAAVMNALAEFVESLDPLSDDPIRIALDSLLPSSGGLQLSFADLAAPTKEYVAGKTLVVPGYYRTGSGPKTWLELAPSDDWVGVNVGTTTPTEVQESGPDTELIASHFAVLVGFLQSLPLGFWLKLSPGCKGWLCDARVGGRPARSVSFSRAVLTTADSWAYVEFTGPMEDAFVLAPPTDRGQLCLLLETPTGESVALEFERTFEQAAVLRVGVLARLPGLDISLPASPTFELEYWKKSVHKQQGGFNAFQPVQEGHEELLVAVSTPIPHEVQSSKAVWRWWINDVQIELPGGPIPEGAVYELPGQPLLWSLAKPPAGIQFLTVRNEDGVDVAVKVRCDVENGEHIFTDTIHVGLKGAFVWYPSSAGAGIAQDSCAYGFDPKYLPDWQNKLHGAELERTVYMYRGCTPAPLPEFRLWPTESKRIESLARVLDQLNHGGTRGRRFDPDEPDR